MEFYGNHNERLIINISFVISVVMMDRFLNTINHNKIPREITRGFMFPFKGGRLIQVKRTKKDKHGTAKIRPQPFNRGGCLIRVTVTAFVWAKI